MSDEELDPEVLADLQLRAATERDPTRTRGRGARGYDWKPPVFVGAWPCRRPGCQGSFDITAEEVDWLRMFNEELAKRHEKPIDTRDIGWCAACHRIMRATEGDRNRKRVDRMRVEIQKLKAAKNLDGPAERAIIEQLKAWGHPDIHGLVETIRAKREGKNKRSKASEATT